MSVELECAGMKGGLESGDKLAAEDIGRVLGRERRKIGAMRSSESGPERDRPAMMQQVHRLE